MRIPYPFVVFLCVFLLPPVGHARTKLAVLPERETVFVHLDHPDATLVEEERVLTLQPGENRVDFSWQGVRIDPDSIRLAFLSHPDRVTLLSVSYPPGEAALVWNIHSEAALEERVRIAYLLADIDRLVAYKAIADREEKTLDLEGYLVLRNFSGEDFPRARVTTGVGNALELPTVHEETRQIRWFRLSEVPIRKTLTWDAAELPWEPKRLDRDVGIPVYYELENAGRGADHGEALWPGKVRVFQRDGAGSTVFLGEDRVPYAPPGEGWEIYVGDSRDVVVTQRKVREQRVNLRPSRREVRLYDSDEILVTEVENFKDTPVRVDVVQRIAGEWEVRETSHEFEREDASTAVFPLRVPAGETEEIRFHYRRRNIRE